MQSQEKNFNFGPFECPAWLPPARKIHSFFASFQPIYRFHKPRYQSRVLTDLARLLPESVEKILDIGAGNGLMGQTIASLFPNRTVVGVDIHDRFLPSLTIPHAIYDGTSLPFEDATFDGVFLCNVLHHVSKESRISLLREALRVSGGGTLFIKDHLAKGKLARFRLAALDWIGNVPFGGMVEAHYLDADEWQSIFQELDCEVDAIADSRYRKGLWNVIFPNSLEIFLRATPRKSKNKKL